MVVAVVIVVVERSLVSFFSHVGVVVVGVAIGAFINNVRLVEQQSVVERGIKTFLYIDL